MLMQISISPAQALMVDFMNLEKILRGGPRRCGRGVGGNGPLCAPSPVANRLSIPSNLALCSTLRLPHRFLPMRLERRCSCL